MITKFRYLLLSVVFIYGYSLQTTCSQDAIKPNIKDTPPVDFGPIRVGPFDSMTTIEQAVEQYNNRVQKEEWFSRFPKLTADELRAALFDSETSGVSKNAAEAIRKKIIEGKMPEKAVIICDGGGWFREVLSENKRYVISKYDITVEILNDTKRKLDVNPARKILIRRKYENVYTRPD